MTDTFTKNPVQKGGKQKRRKRVMRTFKINEISAVDFGAQEPAKAVLIKRADKSSKNTLDNRVEKILILTSEDGGHQHLLYLDMGAIQQGGGHTSYAQGDMPGENHGHDHGYIINPNGTITIASDHGHTHTVMLGELAERLKLTTALAVQENTVTLIGKKIEDDKEFAASDFALVPDAVNPTTWKYRLVRRSGSNPDRRLVGNAVAALKRGKVPKDECATVIRRVREAWLQAHVGKSRTDMPSVLKRAAV